MFRANPLKRRLAAEGKCLGVWDSLGSPAVSEIFALCGYDFLILDQEHGPAGLETLAHQLRALSGTEAAAIVRVTDIDVARFKTILDLGPDGFMIPNVRSAEEARTIVRACRYPPAGIRGIAHSAARAASYGLEAEEYFRRVNDELVLMCQIESRAGVAACAEIAAVDGVDVLFLGLNDLAGDCGVPGQFSHPDVQAEVRRFEDAVRASGRRLGSIPQPGLSCQTLFDQGYSVAAGSVDVLILREHARREMAEHRAKWR
jgi:4-hydroxy-2-oxoheptanedioate aldolase